MFATHATRIKVWASESPDHLARVIQLAIVSAHAPFHRTVQDMALAQGREEEAQSVLFGWKWNAFHSAWEARHDIAERLSLSECPNDALAFLASFHGLAFAKAGFALQMAFGISGCLDVHNLRRWGINPYVIRSRIKERVTSPATHLRRATEYNQICADHGGTSGLWDTWCEYVASVSPKRYRDAFHVSGIHCAALGLPVD